MSDVSEKIIFKIFWIHCSTVTEDNIFKSLTILINLVIRTNRTDKFSYQINEF